MVVPGLRSVGSTRPSTLGAVWPSGRGRSPLVSAGVAGREIVELRLDIGQMHAREIGRSLARRLHGEPAVSAASRLPVWWSLADDEQRGCLPSALSNRSTCMGGT